MTCPNVATIGSYYTGALDPGRTHWPADGHGLLHLACSSVHILVVISG